ncbi:hypothetical protein FGO68_gene8516 [Halteria grandinella]|uniref:Uncharacterized protein n=1 Tax=Halteria grandinella TaxID=5974 RepID=A0A8J8NV86_HALGN|nr:hypothetical protein FGO68_gene8516 [Halteria grandinella]
MRDFRGQGKFSLLVRQYPSVQCLEMEQNWAPKSIYLGLLHLSEITDQRTRTSLIMIQLLSCLELFSSCYFLSSMPYPQFSPYPQLKPLFQNY